MSVQFQFGINKRLKQFQRHLLRQTALMQFEFRTDGNNRTTGVVNTLTKQVLTETTLLTFEHIGQRFKRTFVRTGNGTGTATIIKQSINRFLQHAFFVADDNIRRMQFHQSLQTVVAVDNPAIQIVQVRSCKPAAVQRNQRTQFRRNNRQNIQNHPFRFGVGINECLNDLQSLNQFLSLRFGSGIFQFLTNSLAFGFQINRGQNLFQSFGTDTGAERIFAILVNGFLILFFTQKLINRKRCQTRFDNNVAFKIKHTFQSLHRNIGQNRNP